MAYPDADGDEQDQSEVFDEDNTNLQDRPPGQEEAEQFEDLVDLMDVTAKAGDADEDEPEIGEDLDDDQIVARAREEDDDDLDLRDDDLLRGEEQSFAQEDELSGIADGDDPDVRDAIDARRSGEVDLEYVGDLNDLEGAASAAQSLEADTLSDRDLRELDYKDEYTRDEDDADAPPRPAG
jgi:hypothetical protein